jgi:3-deoxy-D-manno-octulosonic-acid transferase
LRKNYQEANYVFYLPLDTRINANEFISIVKPHLAIFVKYEFWLNYINECKINDIPLVLISARFSKNQIFFKKYGKLFLKALESFKLIFVQDEESKKLIESVKYSIVNIANDTRFDRVAQVANNAQEIPLIDQFISNYKNVLVCGSTWEADEIILASLYSSNKSGSLKIIIAPHEINTNNLNRLQNLFPSSVKYSQLTNSNPESEVLIIDNIGMLSTLYKYASICYIGGGFGKGIHNTLEAAVYGKPILFGPNYTKFNEANDLIKLKSAFCVSDKSSLIKTVESLLNNNSLYINSSSSSKNYVYSKTGGTEFILTKMIEENLL